MPVTILPGTMPETDEKTDEKLRQIIAALERYAAVDPKADIQAYRMGEFTVCVRVVSESFRRVPRERRIDRVWKYLVDLPLGALNDVSLVVVTPKEKDKLAESIEFDNPVPFPPLPPGLWDKKPLATGGR